MYKQLLLLSLFSLTTISQSTMLEDKGRYYQLIETSTMLMFKSQAPFMEEKAYFNFIAPYLLEAEKSLSVMSSFKKDGISKIEEALALSYFELLRRVNVEAFYTFMDPKKIYPHSYNDLYTIIAKIKLARTKTKLADNIFALHTHNEVKRTLALFKEANKAFYKKLSLGQKAYLKLYA